jgi:hypothetical protein
VNQPCSIPLERGTPRPLGTFGDVPLDVVIAVERRAVLALQRRRYAPDDGGVKRPLLKEVCHATTVSAAYDI